VVYDTRKKKVGFVITPETDLIQEEFYPLVHNFGFEVWRKNVSP
jgi:hypothetical protein